MAAKSGCAMNTSNIQYMELHSADPKRAYSFWTYLHSTWSIQVHLHRDRQRKQKHSRWDSKLYKIDLSRKKSTLTKCYRDCHCSFERRRNRISPCYQFIRSVLSSLVCLLLWINRASNLSFIRTASLIISKFSSSTFSFSVFPTNPNITTVLLRVVYGEMRSSTDMRDCLSMIIVDVRSTISRRSTVYDSKRCITKIVNSYIPSYTTRKNTIILLSHVVWHNTTVYAFLQSSMYSCIRSCMDFVIIDLGWFGFYWETGTKPWLVSILKNRSGRQMKPDEITTFSLLLNADLFPKSERSRVHSKKDWLWFLIYFVWNKSVLINRKI